MSQLRYVDMEEMGPALIEQSSEMLPRNKCKCKSISFSCKSMFEELSMPGSGHVRARNGAMPDRQTGIKIRPQHAAPNVWQKGEVEVGIAHQQAVIADFPLGVRLKCLKDLPPPVAVPLLACEPPHVVQAFHGLWPQHIPSVHLLHARRLPVLEFHLLWGQPCMHCVLLSPGKAQAYVLSCNSEANTRRKLRLAEIPAF